jgi:hypothetical protein
MTRRIVVRGNKAGGGMSIAIGRPVIRKTDRIFFSGMALASAVILFLGFCRAISIAVRSFPR